MSLQPAAPRTEARRVWKAWGRGCSDHSLSSRRADLASFGALSWGARDSSRVILHVLRALRSDPGTLRALAVAWIDHEKARGMSPATLAQRWRTLAALLALIARLIPAEFDRSICSLGPRPRVERRKLRRADVSEIVGGLLEVGNPRDAAIVGLIGELGYTDRGALALRVRDVATLDATPELAAALVRAIRGARPQDFAIRNARGESLSRAAVYEIVEHAGTSVADLRRVAAREA